MDKLQELLDWMEANTDKHDVYVDNITRKVKSLQAEASVNHIQIAKASYLNRNGEIKPCLSILVNDVLQYYAPAEDLMPVSAHIDASKCWGR